MDATALSSSTAAKRSPRVLIPFDSREAVSLPKAAKIADKSESTIRFWCRAPLPIGRRIGGAWAVSRVALAMWLEGDLDGLAAYLDGVRAEYEPVARYYRRLGLGELLKCPGFAAAA
jgi:hypothetical protein